MVNNRLYYRFKPFLPKRLRMGARRLVAQAQRRRTAHSWPINEHAGATPAGWPGWPKGEKFALVLTHDVEGASGLAKCRQLMQLEQALGFRSSFNFIPEGDEYRVSAAQREELTSQGFEVGVHDLRHDGKLYWRRKVFPENARSINRYLEQWGAHGFRSGFMLHELDWLHQLDIRYDSSTFDTDPFEPQPDGMETIFPFWMPRPDGGGYVELPYTLPQDSTLFLVLQESSPEIWKRKLDWIAEKGGMALLNVHPDWVSFDPTAKPVHEFPCAHYREFLEYVRTRYANQYWQPLPREMAAYVSGFRPAGPRLPRRKICMISYSDYQTDNRVSRYAEALAGRGDTVDILGIRRQPQQPAEEMVGQVRVLRIQERYGKKEKGKGGYLWPLLKFWLLACFQLTRQHIRKRYDLIHVHNIPDFLVFAAWLPKLTGAKVILDIHDVVPEFYASKFKLEPDSFGVNTLKFVERVSAGFAHHVIISNHLWHKMFVARSVAAASCSVYINNVNQRIFYRRLQPARHLAAPVILFPGGLQWHQGLDLAIRAMTQVVAKIPGAQLHIYGDGNQKEELLALTQELGLVKTVRFFEPLPVDEIAQVMSQADLGVVPKRADSFGNEAYSTKIMEFMSLGVPVVVSSTKIDRFYFTDSVVRFFESGKVDALAGALLELLQDGQLRQRLIANALEYAAHNSWNVRKCDYLELVDSLIERRPVVPTDGITPAAATGREGGLGKTTGLRTTDYGTKAERGERVGEKEDGRSKMEDGEAAVAGRSS